jgi:hypothetical protein
LIDAMRAKGCGTRIALAATLAGCILSPRAGVTGEASPAADTVGITTLDLKTGAVTHCDANKPRSAAEKAKSTKAVNVAFVTVSVDSCDWGDMRASKEDGNWMLYRIGSDVACLIEALDVPGVANPDPGPGSYLNYVRNNGLIDARSLANDTARIDGKSWRHEVVQGTLPPQSPATEGSVQRSAIWSWYAQERLVSLTCYGPSEAFKADAARIQAVASSLRIAPSKKAP